MRFKTTLIVILMLINTLAINAQQQDNKKEQIHPKDLTQEQRKSWEHQRQALSVLPVDVMWSILSLNLTVSEDTYHTLQKSMMDAWQKRQKVLIQTHGSGSWKKAKEELKQQKKTLDQKLKTTLQKSDQKQLKNLLKQNRTLYQTFRTPVQHDIFDHKMQAFHALPIPAMWAALSFDLTLADNTRQTLRDIMKTAWQKRQSHLAHAIEYGSWKDINEELQDLRKVLNTEIETMLNSEQQKQFATLLSQQKHLREPDIR